MADEQALSPSVTPPPTEADYEAIFAAVMETMRGRWFLAEYAKRNRNADTGLLLEAIARVETALRESRAAAPVSPADRVRIDLIEMAKAIAQTRAEIASIKPERDEKGSLSEATEELDSIIHTTESATSDILAAAEQVQEIAWTLREHGTDCEACDALDRRAADIYTACSFQDLTGQRTSKVVEVLRFLETRINATLNIWGGAVPASEAPVDAAVAPHIHDEPGTEHLDQPHIDEMIPGAATDAVAQQPVEVASEPPATDVSPAEQAPSAQPAEPDGGAPDASAADLAARVATPDSEPPTATAPDDAAPAPAPDMSVSEAAETPASEPAPEAAPAATVKPAAEHPIVPAVAVVGATVLELSQPEIAMAAVLAAQPAPADDAEAATSQRADPAALLEKILAIIHEPMDAPAGDAGGGAKAGWEQKAAPRDPAAPASPSLHPPRGALLDVDSAAAWSGRAAPTARPATPAEPAALPAIDPIPFAGYASFEQLSVADALAFDDVLMDVPVRADLSPASPHVEPPAFPVQPSAAAAAAIPQPVVTLAPVAVPKPAATPEPPRRQEPLAQLVSEATPKASVPEPAAPPAARAAASTSVAPVTDPAQTTAAAPEPPPAREPVRSESSPVRLSPAPDRAEPPPAEPAVPPAATAATPVQFAAATQKPAPAARHESLAAFMALSDEEKIALFS